MAEHDGCVDCIYTEKKENEFPCNKCTGTGHDIDAWSDVDNVNHPSHYCQEDSMECIDEMLLVFGRVATQHFCLLNVWKYRKRACFKNGEEDMKKSDWYMKKYNELLDGDI